MKVRVVIPRFVSRLWDATGDWTNEPVYTRGKIEARRIDVLLALFGIGIFLYYLVFHNWQMAVLSTLSYIMVIMMSLWFL